LYADIVTIGASEIREQHPHKRYGGTDLLLFSSSGFYNIASKPFLSINYGGGCA